METKNSHPVAAGGAGATPPTLASAPESLADIVREMRRNGRLASPCRHYADRIEAAAKREKAAIEADALAVGGIVATIAERSSAVGNGVAMREALEALIAYWDWNGFDAMRESQLKDMARAALAAPPRNCDVGTTEEQYARFREHCFSKRCESLITKNTLGSEVAFVWAQMPYEEGGDE